MIKRLLDHYSFFRAEITARMEAASWLLNSSDYRNLSQYIYSDSQDALKSIRCSQTYLNGGNKNKGNFKQTVGCMPSLDLLSQSRPRKLAGRRARKNRNSSNHDKLWARCEYTSFLCKIPANFGLHQHQQVQKRMAGWNHMQSHQADLTIDRYQIVFRSLPA